ncbi:MAG: hypothetical protein M3R55_17000, partial [Acidobacteriota bacterium]|nr:hypothetical protein [Acidobacteriota bacterium]
SASILLAGLACASLSASVIVPADLPTLVTEAQSIVLGRVTEVRPIVRADRRRVDSYVVFAVEESIKGSQERTVIFRTLGGVNGRYRTVVPGSPVFAAGDEAVIFLGRSRGAAPFPIGLSQGVFRVRRDVTSGARRILAPPMLIDPARSMTVRRGDGTRVPIAVEGFTALVRGLAAPRQP